MKLTRSFEPDSRSTRYTWSVFVEGRELCYTAEVDKHSTVPVHYLEHKAQRAIMDSLGREIFGDSYRG